MLHESVFGKFFRNNCMNAQKSLIHNLLRREADQDQDDCKFFLFGGKPVYIGIEHFALVTGLPVTAVDDYKMLVSGASEEFCSKYFLGIVKDITKGMMERILKKENVGTSKQQKRIQVENDKDNYIIAMVYFIIYYIMGK